MSTTNIKQKYSKKSSLTSYKFCGAPFFKDSNLFSAPPNDDYLYRSSVLKELFPIDIQSNSVSVWTVKDKIALIQGVKSQVIDYLETKNAQAALTYNSPRNKKLTKEIAVHSNLLTNLLKKVGKNFQINWYLISTDSIGQRHPEHCCKAMWDMYLKPELNRNSWDDDENKTLFKIAEKNQFQNWEKIAKDIKDRSSYQCILQFQTNIVPSMRDKNIKWTKEQDKLLKEAVESNRVGEAIPWNRVASHFPHKTKMQVYVRYKYSLDPNIRKGEFTKEEDCIILAAVQQYGEDFRVIPRSLFKNRTISQVKGRYLNVLKHSTNHRVWSPEDDKKLLELVEKHGRTNWVAISKDLKYHSRTSCRTRYNIIQKHLANNPDKTIEDLPRKRKGTLSDVTMDNWLEKIIEIKTHGEKKKVRRKQIRKETYRERRRTLERDYYEFFKYSYDFAFGELKSSILEGVKPIVFLQHFLNIDINPDVIKQNKTKFTKAELKILMESLKPKSIKLINKEKITDDYNLPPSLCTILGLRAVCIQITTETVSDDIDEIDETVSEDIDETDETKENVSVKTEFDEEEFEMHKLLFKQRFFKTFYKTALLSKYSPLMLKGITENNTDKVTEPSPKKRKTQQKLKE